MSPTSGSQPKGLALGGGAPRAFGFECRSAGALKCRSSTGMGETDSTLGGLTQGFMCTGTQDKAVTPYKPELDLPAGLRGYPGEVGVSYGSL